MHKAGGLSLCKDAMIPLGEVAVSELTEARSEPLWTPISLRYLFTLASLPSSPMRTPVFPSYMRQSPSREESAEYGVYSASSLIISRQVSFHSKTHEDTAILSLCLCISRKPQWKQKTINPFATRHKPLSFQTSLLPIHPLDLELALQHISILVSHP